jgi:hypothetical protein
VPRLDKRLSAVCFRDEGFGYEEIQGYKGGLPHSVFKEELTEGVASEPGIVARSDYTA